MTAKLSQLACGALALIALMFPASLLADTWQLQVGAQSGDQAHQALAFLPNEIWIHAGDSITWTFATDEVHTVSFLKPGQVRPASLVGCPGATPDGSLETGTTCVNSGRLVKGTYTVIFPITGNFKLVCLVHTNMTATIHVLDLSAPLPHDQAFYDKESHHQRADLLSDALASSHVHPNDNSVVAGAGKIMATGGGSETASVMRFIDATKVIRVGETVEWTNSDAVTPHTITFGPEPADLMPPSANVTLDADGARHATISSPSDIVHSGFIAPTPQDRIGLAQAPLGVPRFRVTFTQPGTFDYKCSLHDDLGMFGRIIVLP